MGWSSDMMEENETINFEVMNGATKLKNKRREGKEKVSCLQRLHRELAAKIV